MGVAWFSCVLSTEREGGSFLEATATPRYVPFFGFMLRRLRPGKQHVTQSIYEEDTAFVFLPSQSTPFPLQSSVCPSIFSRAGIDHFSLWTNNAVGYTDSRLQEVRILPKRKRNTIKSSCNNDYYYFLFRLFIGVYIWTLFACFYSNQHLAGVNWKKRGKLTE